MFLKSYLWGAQPPWTSEIYGFQGVFSPQRVLSPPLRKEKNVKPPGQIPEYAPGLLILYQIIKSVRSRHKSKFNLVIVISEEF